MDLSNVSTVHYPINLAYLSEFLNPEELFNLTPDTLLNHTVDTDLRDLAVVDKLQIWGKSLMDEWCLAHQCGLGDECATPTSDICAFLESGQTASSSPSSTFCGNQNSIRVHSPLFGRVSFAQNATGSVSHIKHGTCCTYLSGVAFSFASSICTSIGEILKYISSCFHIWHFVLILYFNLFIYFYMSFYLSTRIFF